MLKNEFLQYAVLKFAVTINTDGFGRPATWGGLSSHIREMLSDLTDIELMNVLLLLYGRQQLVLQKFQGDIPYWTLTEYYQYPVKKDFFNGDFRLLVTPEGQPYLDELEAKAYSTMPVAAPVARPRIGFLS